MVLATEVDSVHVHSPIICPIVCQGDNELDPRSSCSIDHLVKKCHINRGCAVCPPLEDRFRRACSLTTIQGEAIWIIGYVLVIKPPSTEDPEPSVIGSRESFLDIFLGLRDISGGRKGVNSETHALKRQVVCIATGEVEILAV